MVGIEAVGTEVGPEVVGIGVGPGVQVGTEAVGNAERCCRSRDSAAVGIMFL